MDAKTCSQNLNVFIRFSKRFQLTFRCMPRLHPKLRARAAQQGRGEGKKRKSAKEDKRDSHKKRKKPKDEARRQSSSNQVTPNTTGNTSPPAPSDNAIVPPRVSAPAVLAPPQASYPPQPSFPAPSQAFVPQSLTAPGPFQGSVAGYQGSFQPPVPHLLTANLHPFGFENGPTLDDISVAAQTTIHQQATEIAFTTEAESLDHSLGPRHK